MSMKISNDTIGNRARDLPTCSAVPQPTAPPRSPETCRVLFQNKINLRYCASGWFYFVIQPRRMFSSCWIVSTTLHQSWLAVQSGFAFMSKTIASNVNHIIFTQTWLHVSVCTCHHQIANTKLSKQGRRQCNCNAQYRPSMCFSIYCNVKLYATI